MEKLTAKHKGLTGLIQDRKYQVRDKKNIKKAFESYRSVLFQCPTGGGKSVIAADLVDEWLNGDGKINILVMGHRRELLQQFNTHFSGRDIEVGMMRGKIERNMDANVVVASVFTATRDNRLKTLLKRKWDYIIVDECHRIMSESYAKPIREIREVNKDCRLLGLTATPYRLDKKNLAEQFDKLLCSDNIAKLIKDGYLSDYKTFATPVRELEDVDTTNSGHDYKQEPLSAYMRTEKQIAYLVRSYKEYGQNKQMIVYCVDRKHARDVESAYKKGGYKSVGYIDGNTGEADRENMISDFENNKLKIIVSIDTLTEGVDLPETGCIQLARPTLSLSLYMQMVGRGLRPKKDGSSLIILDNAGCSDSFGLISSPKSWSLNPNIDPNKPREGNKVVAKRKDGTYETDLDEAELLELEEMTHEEFVEKVLNNEEAAQKHNDGINEQIKQMTFELGEAILEASDNKSYEITKKDYWDKNSITVHNKKNKSFTINIKINYDKGRIDFEKGYYSREADYKYVALNAMTVGSFYGQMLVNKNLQKLLKSKMAEIILIALSKIDLGALMSKLKNAKEDALVHKIETHLAKNNVIKMKAKEDVSSYRRYSRIDSYFQTGYQWFNNKGIASIEFERNGLFSKNPMKIYNEDGDVIYESQSTKKDKVLEIIRGCDPIFKK